MGSTDTTSVKDYTATTAPQPPPSRGHTVGHAETLSATHHNGTAGPSPSGTSSSARVALWMASVHLGWRTACRPNPVAMVRRPSSSTSKRASRSSRVTAAADRPTTYPSRWRCVIVRTTGLFMHFLSVHLDLKRLCAFQSGFHFINEIMRNNFLLFSLTSKGPRRAAPKNETALGLPREPAVQHHKTNGTEATKQLKHDKSQACSQDNITRQRKKTDYAQVHGGSTRGALHSHPCMSPTLIKHDKWNTGVHETMIMHVTFHDGFLLWYVKNKYSAQTGEYVT